MRVTAGTPEAEGLRVFDRATGDEIKHVLWADDETGEHEVLVMGAGGRPVLDGEEFRTERRRSAIELRRHA